MFDIEYKGANSLVITTKKTTLVVDPKLSIVEAKDVAVKDAVQLATEARFMVGNQEARLAVEGPGEYEVGDFSIRGIAATRHIDEESIEKAATIYRLEVGDTRIALIGNITATLSEDQLEELGVIDIVVVPVGGGGYTLDAAGAAALVRKIDPKVVIPIHYADPTLKYEVPQDDVEGFVKDLGAPVEVVAKYKVKAQAALPAVLTIVKVERS
jgi:L-ascorbate metabolism protein UlaG (beta-lactamase superfamily)